MKRFFAALVCAVYAVVAHAAAGPRTYAAREDVREFVVEMVSKHGFARRDLDLLFAKTHFQPSILKAMTPLTRGTRSWQSYRARFVNARRIDAGVAFWSRYPDALERAAQAYGVPPEIIVAIVGVETEYGQQMGGYRAVDALATLAFDYPRRADYFRTELEEFLLLARETGVDVLAVNGSYAGALGLPQFMPSSYRRFAVDFDGDGRRDLRGSAVDAIGSVANFLKEHGWVAGAPIAFRAEIETPEARALADGSVEPQRLAGELRDASVRFTDSVAAETPSVLVELDSIGAPSEYWVGFRNFYVLTRYNRSSFYAISVLELASEIRAARQRPG